MFNVLYNTLYIAHTLRPFSFFITLFAIWMTIFCANPKDPGAKTWALNFGSIATESLLDVGLPQYKPYFLWLKTLILQGFGVQR